MSALEFALENLFGPLDIKDVYWPADSQGVSWGWGELAMYPRDMAKIGLLWLNKGLWDGQQIISQKWMEEAVTKQSGTDRGQDYGYGLWLNDDEIFSYMASGRNGQEITVVPELGVILVKTGGGYDPEVMDVYLGSAVGDLINGMPENPEGEAQLLQAVAAVLEAPEAEPIPDQPAIASEISGKRFFLEGSEILNSSWMIITFLDSGEAKLEYTANGEAEPRVSLVGLDGHYRASLAGKPVFAAVNGWMSKPSRSSTTRVRVLTFCSL